MGLEETAEGIRRGVHNALLSLAEKGNVGVPTDLPVLIRRKIGNAHYIHHTLVVPAQSVDELLPNDRAQGPAEQKRQRVRKSWERARHKAVNFYRIGPAELRAGEEPTCTADRDFLLGMLAGLVLQSRTNTALAPFFKTLNLAKREQDQRYHFWSMYASTYAGLVYVQRAASSQCDDSVQRALALRRLAKEKTDDTGLVGSEYAAQIYLNHGSGKLVDVLTASDITKIHAVVKPCEDFWLYARKGWDAANA